MFLHCELCSHKVDPAKRKTPIDKCNVTHYIEYVIRSFRHAGLERFYRTGSKAGIQPDHAKKLRLQLLTLNQATKPEDMGIPSWRLHELKGNLAGHWSVKVNGNWRMTFKFEKEDAVLVDYQDYH